MSDTMWYLAAVVFGSCIMQPTLSLLWELIKLKIKNKTRRQKALNFIRVYGGIDGDQHKKWLLDQLVIILTYDYKTWVEDYETNKEGRRVDTWDTGIAP